MIKLTKWLLVFTWMVFIFISSQVVFGPEDPNKQKNILEIVFDKDVHLIFYGILSFLIINVLVEYKIRYYRIALISLFICYFYGITDEAHQSFVPYRGVSFADLLFDVIGAIFGIIIYQLWNTVKKNRGLHARFLHKKGDII